MHFITDNVMNEWKTLFYDENKAHVLEISSGIVKTWV